MWRDWYHAAASAFVSTAPFMTFSLQALVPLQFIMTPSPRYFAHKLFPINFLFVKLSHHLLGFPSPTPAASSYTRAKSLDASSCRTCERYWRSVSASWRLVGEAYIYSGRTLASVNLFEGWVEAMEKGRGGPELESSGWGKCELLTWLRGKPGSPGMAKLLSSAMFWTSFWASLCGGVCQQSFLP